jgi:tetratricopeptide (TPR) repeat protein
VLRVAARMGVVGVAAGVCVVVLVAGGQRLLHALGVAGTALAACVGAAQVAWGAAKGGWVRRWLSLPPRPRPLLPPSVPGGLTGRARELGEIRDRAGQLLGRRAGTEVVVLWGMSGIGKTTLAAAVAREYGKAFGIVGVWDFLDCPDGGQRQAGEALAGLLRTVARMPAESLREAQPGGGRGSELAILWQDWASRHPTLLVLENVSTFAQVENLIPGEGMHLVLITARRRLGHLPGPGYLPVLLDGLGDDDGLRLLEKEAGRRFSGDEQPEAEELVRWAGGLPLAICLLAAILRDGTSKVADLLTEFRAGGALTVVDERCQGRESVSAAAGYAFRWRLTPPAQRAFLLLALHPLGHGIDAGAVQALTGTSQVHAQLRELCSAALLHPENRNGSQQRYRMHQLLREYACGQLHGALTSAETCEAIERLFSHYWHTAGEVAAPAEPCLTRHTRPGASPAPAPAGPGSSPPGSQRRRAALDWFEAHRDLLMACLGQAMDRHLDRWVVRLTAAMAGFLRNNGPWDQGIIRHAAAVRAAADLGDPIAHGVALNDLGIMYRLAGRHDQALAALQQAHAIFTGTFPASTAERDLWLGQANALNEQGIVHNDRGDHGAAMLAVEPALVLYRKAGDPIGVANASKNLGVALYRAGLDGSDTGRCAQALRCLGDATDGYAAIGDELGVAEVANHQGRLHLHGGDVADALADFHRALDMVDGTGNLLEAARAREGAGDCHRLTRDYDLARRNLETARQLYTDIRAGQHARDVAAKLVRLAPPPR